MSATESPAMELSISVKGEILKSNFDEFETYALEQLDGINTDLNTDEDFGQAAADEKALKVTEKKFKEVEDQILAEMDAVSDLIKRTRGLGEKYASKRLALSKALKDRKAEIIAGITKDAIAMISIKDPEASPRITAAIKGKRTLESIKKHATAEAIKIEAEVQRARSVVEEFLEEHGRDIVYDEHKLLVMDAGIVEAELSRRVERRAAEREKERLRQQAEKARASEAPKVTEPAQPASAPPADLGPEIPPLPFGQAEFSKEESAAQELTRYLDTLRSCLGPIREARASLQHEENIKRVGEFAATLNAAFAKLKGGTR